MVKRDLSRRAIILPTLTYGPSALGSDRTTRSQNQATGMSFLRRVAELSLDGDVRSEEESRSSSRRKEPVIRRPPRRSGGSRQVLMGGQVGAGFCVRGAHRHFIIDAVDSRRAQEGGSRLRVTGALAPAAPPPLHYHWYLHVSVIILSYLLTRIDDHFGTVLHEQTNKVAGFKQRSRLSVDSV